MATPIDGKLYEFLSVEWIKAELVKINITDADALDEKSKPIIEKYLQETAVLLYKLIRRALGVIDEPANPDGSFNAGMPEFSPGYIGKMEIKQKIDKCHCSAADLVAMLTDEKENESDIWKEILALLDLPDVNDNPPPCIDESTKFVWGYDCTIPGFTWIPIS